MKDVIQNEHGKVLGWLTHLPESAERDDLRKVINESFNAILVEADFVITHLEGDAGRLEMAAAKLPRMGTLLAGFAKALRYYARRLADSTATKEPPPRLIVLPDSGGSNGRA